MPHAFKRTNMKRKKKGSYIYWLFMQKYSPHIPGNEIVAKNFINKLNILTSCNKFVILKLL